MKKYLILLTVIFISADLSAQVRTGLIGGINFGGVKSDNTISPDFDRDSYFAFGILTDIVLDNNLSLQLEPQYIEKGGRLNLQQAFNTNFNLSLSYLEIPVLLKYSRGNEFRPYIIAGPSVSFNLSSEMGIELAGFQLNTDISGIVKDVNFGLVIGTGLSYHTELITLLVEGKYTYSLSRFTKSGRISSDIEGELFEQSINDELNLKSSDFQIMAGFLLPIE